ncbi:TetR/AcrR family transcriptional regulator [Promicromonospora thailandica]|uniref:Transcriptional regulator, TetR family n=1 Tax=Promicromonospora thailandica TaxID=765201 RepID=A0A9X2G423_9MICO|nr:TetR/AcrR family transcriptional regulator [Promicromonospora thailandica]MCP2265283.1 transcriptional regulator, TetR family [Promicromonospora thailandica]
MSTDTTPEQPEPEETAADPLPAAVRRLWGAAAPRRRGPKPALSTARIVRAAMGLADAEGLAAVSMARVAEALGYTPMALYRHVANKEELLLLMVDAVAEQAPEIPDDAGWRAGLELWTRAQIELGVRRPWMLELPLSSALPGPNRVRWMDQAFKVMRTLDLPADEKLAVIGLLAQHVLGQARVEVESRRAAVQIVLRESGLPATTPEPELDPAAVAAANPWADLEAMLVRHAEPTAYPHLFESFATWQPPEGEPADEVGFGMGILLDGIEAYLRRRGALPDAE